MKKKAADLVVTQDNSRNLYDRTRNSILKHPEKQDKLTDTTIDLLNKFQSPGRDGPKERSGSILHQSFDVSALKSKINCKIRVKKRPTESINFEKDEED